MRAATSRSRSVKKVGGRAKRIGAYTYGCHAEPVSAGCGYSEFTPAGGVGWRGAAEQGAAQFRLRLGQEARQAGGGTDAARFANHFR